MSTPSDPHDDVWDDVPGHSGRDPVEPHGARAQQPSGPPNIRWGGEPLDATSEPRDATGGARDVVGERRPPRDVSAGPSPFATPHVPGPPVDAPPPSQPEPGMAPPPFQAPAGLGAPGDTRAGPGSPWTSPGGPSAFRPVEAGRRRGRVLGGSIAAGVALLVVVLLAVVPLALRTPVLDGRQVEAGVRSILGTDLHHTVSHVRCPDDVAVRAGTTFTCTAVVDGQPTRVIPVTITGGNGDYDVDAPR